MQEVSAWDQYRWYILGAIVIVWLQAGLIAALLAQRIRRRRVEEDLRTAYEQNRDLAGRLIHAQEAERTRIARDLHDDVGQQLAGLAIIASGLKRKMAKPGGHEEIEEGFATLQERAAAVAQSIRTLSHELHPTVLQHAGLVAAVKRQCSDVEQLHHLRVTFSAGDGVDHLHPDVALCLYRVTQEALSNIVRHAHASTVDVRLSATGYDVELSITDDGIGFVRDTGVGRGLGLRSIDERVRLSSGRVAVRTSAGKGTVVFVSIPLA